MPVYLWGVIGCVTGLILATIIIYRRKPDFWYRILVGLLVALWFLSAIAILRFFWGQAIIIVVFEIVAFAVLVVLVNLLEKHIAYKIATRWCNKEFSGNPDSMSLILTGFRFQKTFKNSKTVRVQRDDTSWILIISLNELKVVSVKKE
ncbi:hypothetical protein AMJ52_08870 [candidate division TA06 bacterium DG_78]|uniref:Uncharacterized protein n=1 Tax=candidate division TA06 bacterium DG_78 TaxID=1703772 RepID=A0A0S7YA02_UNCT6|nr:MAG: hypothetical protein AMJ52_08870 [candidate division TA06 bacterium DG_78]